MLTLGSLFDGSGGFPLAGAINGIKPLWASEIEPYPIRVTKARFPQMKHLGSVLDIKGGEIDPVDIITFGSPCQDLSVAGKQKGIHEGERSSLFFEAIRIIKEMRHATADKYPRFAVWENVPGAFSSNKGADFQAVLQAFCEIRGGCNHIVPQPPKGKWGHAGCIVGDGFSVAWRLYDAQYWGVPQRRKRIYLIADFASERAGEILFEREGLCGDSAEGGEARQGTADDAQGGAGGSGRVGLMATGFKANQGPKAGGIGWQEGLACTLNADCPGLEPTVCYDTTQITSPLNYSNPKPGDACHPLAAQQHPPLAVYGIGSYHSNAWKSGNPYSGVYEADVAKTLDLNGGNPACNQGGGEIVVSIDCRNMVSNGNLSGTLQSNGRSLNQQNPVVYDARGNGGGTRCQR